MGVAHINISQKRVKEDIIRVHLEKRKIKINARLFKYRDKDTRQIIYYIPSLAITGYGNTDEKAIEMLNFRPLPTKCWESFYLFMDLDILEPQEVMTNGRKRNIERFLCGEMKKKSLPYT